MNFNLERFIDFEPIDFTLTKQHTQGNFTFFDFELFSEFSLNNFYVFEEVGKFSINFPINFQSDEIKQNRLSTILLDISKPNLIKLDSRIVT